ncbi:MAG: ornithine cyclodeaminase family protein [Thermoleophilia bacterium]|nr:ornithine cyclodeaminase family protein [Thermoleophilia bacterium]
MTPVDYLCLSQEDVIAAGGLDMDGCLAAIDETLSLYQRGEAICPQKASLHWSEGIDSEERDGRIMAMPAWVGGSLAMAGMKWIPSVPSNPSRGLPRGIGVIVLSDPETGLPLAVMDGTVVSAMRTGAVSGLAARELAPPDARTLAIVGLGVQARTQLLALERTLPGIEEIRVYDPSEAQVGRFLAEQSEGRPPLVPVESPRAAVSGCDVLVAATMAPEPWFAEDWWEAGQLFLCVSGHDPELAAITAADLLVTDDVAHETHHPTRPLARAEGAGLLDRDAVVPLGAILTGDHPGRTAPDERILVTPVGMGIEDVGWAARVYRRAVESGLGRRERLWDTPIWT